MVLDIVDARVNAVTWDLQDPVDLLEVAEVLDPKEKSETLVMLEAMVWMAYPVHEECLVESVILITVNLDVLVLLDVMVPREMLVVLDTTVVTEYPERGESQAMAAEATMVEREKEVKLDLEVDQGLLELHLVPFLVNQVHLATEDDPVNLVHPEERSATILIEIVSNAGTLFNTLRQHPVRQVHQADGATEEDPDDPDHLEGWEGKVNPVHPVIQEDQVDQEEMAESAHVVLQVTLGMATKEIPDQQVFQEDPVTPDRRENQDLLPGTDIQAGKENRAYLVVKGPQADQLQQENVPDLILTPSWMVDIVVM